MSMTIRVAINGYGRIGREIAEQLSGEGVPLLVVELDPDRISEATCCGLIIQLEKIYQNIWQPSRGCNQDILPYTLVNSACL